MVEVLIAVQVNCYCSYLRKDHSSTEAYNHAVVQVMRHTWLLVRKIVACHVQHQHYNLQLVSLDVEENNTGSLLLAYWDNREQQVAVNVTVVMDETFAVVMEELVVSMDHQMNRQV